MRRAPYATKVPKTTAVDRLRHLAPRGSHVTIIVRLARMTEFPYGVSFRADSEDITPYVHAVTTSIRSVRAPFPILVPPWHRANPMGWLNTLICDVGLECFGTLHPWKLAVDYSTP